MFVGVVKSLMVYINSKEQRASPFSLLAASRRTCSCACLCFRV